MALTVSFAAFDWAMSLNPHWFSSVYGILFIISDLLSAVAFTVVVLAYLSPEKPVRPGGQAAASSTTSAS